MGKRAVRTTLFAAAVIGAFLAGTWQGGRPPVRASAKGERPILRYACPMHPQHTSDQPGDAPCCGMKLVPVYAGGAAVAAPGGVAVGAAQQQLMGIQVAAAERRGDTRCVRLLGRVAADETRIYRVTAASDGWIRETYTNITGSLVRKNEPLASFYSPEFLSGEQALLYAAGALDRLQSGGKETEQQLQLTRNNIQQAVDALRNLGMNEIQIREIRETRTPTQNIVLYSPTDGFVLARNISPQQRFERGIELYRIADLSRVWIVADLFENDARWLKGGAVAEAVYHGRRIAVRAIDVLPQFDPGARTLKVRFEAPNLDYALRPDMFVDVELPGRLPEALTVPADAVLDSGMRKVVYVEKSAGSFEPRVVRTGWRAGDRVEIVDGLMAGDRVVVSGNFLLDSETRMKNVPIAAAATAKDPVCGMEVDPTKAAGKSDFKGKTYYFCSAGCKKTFDHEPARYAPAGKNAVASLGVAHD